MQPIYFLSAFLFAAVMALPIDERRSEVLSERQDGLVPPGVVPG